jgi:hypothetical protein
MSIKTKKVNKADYYEIQHLSDEHEWLDDEDYQKGLLDLWVLIDNSKQKKLIVDLIGRCIHLDEKQRVKKMRELLSNLKSLSLSHKNTIIVATANGEDSDGSAGFQYLFKPQLQKLDEVWKNENLKPNMNSSLIDFNKNKIKNIVLFDDFIGTGVTIIENVKNYKEMLKTKGINGVNLFVFSFAGMSFGIKRAELELELSVICPIVIEKGISFYENDIDTEEMKKEMIKLENKLSHKYQGVVRSSYSLGHGKSEALYNTYSFNCPDNVFPIFWWPTLKDNGRRNTIFNRLVL